jgi:hypothetical protein
VEDNAETFPRKIANLNPKFSSLKKEGKMTNVSSLEGLVSLVFVFICSCALIRRVKVFRSILTWRQFGPLSIFHKASVIGKRLKYQIALGCILLGLYILIR